ncbi:MAG TPA: DUF4249 domain-containing protein [Flavobacteriales bacterium]|nr:DUF4249 domain-containing protein [Flavobacteriales bacterium]
MKKPMIFVFLAATLFMACQKVIEIDLNSAEPQVVVEGFVDDGPGPQEIKLTYTANYFDVNEFNSVQGAIVSISDGTGFTEQLTETSKGVYISSSLQGIPGRTYTLDILANGKDFTSSSTMPEHATIDSTNYDYFPKTAFTVEGNYVTFYFKEITGKGHNYLFVIYQNGEIPEMTNQAGEGPFFVFEDEFFNELNFDFQFYPYPTFPGDTIVIELVSLDHEGFMFYNTLNATLNSASGGFSELPQNPVTNMSDGAIGYFGAVAISRDTIIIN